MTAPLITIRRMQPQDASAVEKIERDNFSEPWPEAEFAKAAQHPAYLCLVASEEDRIAGYAVCTAAAKEADLTNFAVAASYRRFGIGEKLLSVLTDRLKKKGIKQIFLEVRAGNEPAKALYAKAGFEAVGRRKNFYRKPAEDALIMRKETEPKG